MHLHIFRLNDRVQVARAADATLDSTFLGKQGIVTDIRKAWDKDPDPLYWVRLEDGEEMVFWNEELEHL